MDGRDIPMKNQSPPLTFFIVADKIMNKWHEVNPRIKYIYASSPFTVLIVADNQFHSWGRIDFHTGSWELRTVLNPDIIIQRTSIEAWFMEILITGLLER